ncbi:hypothetical protein A2Z00_01210 [Candidatus Gottesmanbacteria bacterium RBG_13_45_10]|uniref:Uncharacterized protein n=1 Tax=Candidatus Gottesmanbacteria bacterium RBG_13_45_10 TaxID=1798370 RepID=A0A1F5ZFG3_9BACT|nr:MAG: hypothetical protein A2Z00_01210 [Candidatus Gottesmanbacteria bacterium RBG_13_45_10]
MILPRIIAIVHAAEQLKGPAGFEDVASIGSLETLFKNVVQAVVALSGVALFVMLVVGGFSFLLSGGDPKKLEQARGTITNAIIGLVIIISAYLILRIIQAITGANVTIFKITSGP